MPFSNFTNYGLLFCRLCLLCAIVLALSAPAATQMDTAILVGRVSDPSGKVIVGARVEMVDIDRNTRNHVQTNASGIYIFPNTRPGHYRVTVSAPGYTTATLPRLAIYVQDDIQQNFRIVPGSPLETVTIHENGTPIDTTGAVGTVIEQDLVQELPLNGRSFQTLFQLTPGAVITPTTFASQGQFSVNGQRTNTNYFIIDGVSANVGITAGINPGQSAAGTLPALTAFGGTNSIISTDDVQEFAVLTSSYSAEFGRVPGGQVSVVSRSGSNEFHGQVFDYLRNDTLDANDWFANEQNLKRAALRQNDYGAVLGGPLFKDRTFFFIAYEGLRLRQPSSSDSDVPSVAARNSARLSLQPFLRAYPLPNGPDDGNGMAQASYAFSNPASLDTGSVRIDYVRESLSSFLRYDNSVSLHQERGAASNSLSTLTDTAFRLHTLTAALTYRLSSNVINDLRFNWSQSSASGVNRLDAFGGAIPLSGASVVPPAFDAREGLFQFVSAPSAEHPELSLGKNNANTQRQINLVDNTAIQLGTHLVKIGFDLRGLFPMVEPASYQQQVVSSTVNAALNGNFLFALIGSSTAVHSEFRSYSAYAQDTWKPLARLSIDGGVRWDFNPAPVGRGSNGLSPVALLSTANLSALTFAPQGTPLYRTPLTNIAPRFGLAYEIRRSSRTETVIRAAAGLFYDLGYDSAGNALAGFVFPFFAQKFITAPEFPLTPVDAAPPAPSFSGPFRLIFAFPGNLKLPYTWQWNISVQQAMGSSQTANIAYVGASGKHLLRTEEYVGGEGGLPPVFSQLLFTRNASSSNYNSLQIRFQRRVTEGVHLIVMYALSHSLDNVSTDTIFNGIPSRFQSADADYGPSDFDIRHLLSMGIHYQSSSAKASTPLRKILLNWAVDSILMVRSAPPVDVVASRDIGFGIYDFRPDLIAGEPKYVYDRAAPGQRKINPASVSIPMEPRQGTLGRNSYRGFPLAQWDLSIGKLFHITEALSVQARIEAFNVLNHSNFAPPIGALGSMDIAGNFSPNKEFGISQSTFGQGLQSGSSANFGSGFSPLYQIGSARSLQLAVKIKF